MAALPRRGARRALAALAATTLAALAVGGAAACRPLEDATIADTASAPDSLPAPDTAAATAGPRDVFAVQVAVHADSAAAERLRDSLAAAGWTAYVRTVRQMDTLPPFRVRVMPTARLELARLVAAGFAAQGRPVALVPDVALPSSPPVTAVPVSRMRGAGVSRLRWTTSGDRSRLLVVEDVEVASGDPAPDAFVYAADEGAVVVQRDSVWDVTVTPDWGRLAYGRAYVVSSEGRDSLSIRGWADVSARTNIQIHVIREGAFRVSRELQHFAVAQPVVESTHPDSLRDQSLVRIVSTQVPIVGGWRVRWTRDARKLAVGMPPRPPARDDAPSPTWLGVDPNTGLFDRELGRAGLYDPAWTSGPVPGPATRPDATPRRIAIDGGAVESGDGWIVVRGTVTDGARVVVGPGTVLTATRSGRFIVALVPVPGQEPGQVGSRATLYRVN